MTPSETRARRLTAEQVRRGLLAGFVAWLIPGAGHLLLRRPRRAAVFFGLVTLAATLGVVFDGNLAVADPRAPVLTRLQVAADLALGPAEPVIRTALYGAPVYSRFGLESGRLSREARAALERRERRFFRRWNHYGTAYLLAACLMNLLVILDAWDIGIGRKD
ncbi:MAG: hypothetical protein D6738_04040 [Acidobacteria bacterium]|nr:MAG: hypothetical protein D6738_04040 [Acidobacteriota bacterium]